MPELLRATLRSLGTAVSGTLSKRRYYRNSELSALQNGKGDRFNCSIELFSGLFDVIGRLGMTSSSRELAALGISRSISAALAGSTDANEGDSHGKPVIFGVVRQPVLYSADRKNTIKLLTTREVYRLKV